MFNCSFTRKCYLHFVIAQSFFKLVKAIAKCHTEQRFYCIRALFHLFRNVMDYRGGECNAAKQCILCYVLRDKSYFTLPFVKSLQDSFCLGSFAHGFTLLSPRVFARLLVGYIKELLAKHFIWNTCFAELGNEY